MTYQHERDEFLALMGREGVTAKDARALLSRASALQRLAQLACSSGRADRDRIPCPGETALGVCLCRDYGSYDHAEGGATGDHGSHGLVPRIAVRGDRIERAVERLCARYGIKPIFQGDPRGAVLILAMPSGVTNDFAGRGIAVPSQGYTAAQLDRMG